MSQKGEQLHNPGSMSNQKGALLPNPSGSMSNPERSMDPNEYNEIQILELEVQAQMTNILQVDKRLQEIDYNLVQIIKRCAEDLSQTQILHNQSKLLQLEQEKEQKKFIELRRQKEETVRQLRGRYRDVIMTYHQKRKTTGSYRTNHRTG